MQVHHSINVIICKFNCSLQNSFQNQNWLLLFGFTVIYDENGMHTESVPVHVPVIAMTEGSCA